MYAQRVFFLAPLPINRAGVALIQNFHSVDDLRKCFSSMVRRLNAINIKSFQHAEEKQVQSMRVTKILQIVSKNGSQRFLM